MLSVSKMAMQTVSDPALQQEMSRPPRLKFIFRIDNTEVHPFHHLVVN